MLIFGWGHAKTKHYGPVQKQQCQNCFNEDYWSLYKQSTWFTLFFIPVFPYKSEYYFLCPICSQGLMLDNYNEIEYLQAIAETNTKLLNGQINEEEYSKELKVISKNFT